MPGRQIRTFLDSGVLITAYSGQPALKGASVDTPGGSAAHLPEQPFVWHEICPKALFNKRHLEYRFYREYFQRAAVFNDVRLILERAGRESARSGISAMDSLHVAAAHLLGADEFITVENPRKSIYRTSLVKVVFLF